jgi:hypothetical protein
MKEFDDIIDVTPGGKPGTYHVFSGIAKDTLAFTADGLLNLGHWILTHRQELINAPSNAADPERSVTGTMEPGEEPSGEIGLQLLDGAALNQERNRQPMTRTLTQAEYQAVVDSGEDYCNCCGGRYLAEGLTEASMPVEDTLSGGFTVCYACSKHCEDGPCQPENLVVVEL